MTWLGNLETKLTNSMQAQADVRMHASKGFNGPLYCAEQGMSSGLGNILSVPVSQKYVTPTLIRPEGFVSGRTRFT